MKLTKYAHACFTLETEGKLLVVDPGNWTTDLPALENVVAVVITHEHADHFDPSALGAIVAHSPDAVIVSHEQVTKQLGDILPHMTVTPKQALSIGPFSLEFFGGTHATIHSSIHPVANLGVMINNLLYYPGDSFTVPGKPVEWLALPVWAPWLKLAEAIDFAHAVKPTHMFPTHDAVASNEGKSLIDRMIPALCSEIDYRRITAPAEITN